MVLRASRRSRDSGVRGQGLHPFGVKAKPGLQDPAFYFGEEMLPYYSERQKHISIVSMALALSLAIIMTACVPRQQLRFIVTGDTRGSDNGVNTSILSEIARAIVEEKADFVLITGDLVNGSKDQAELESQLTTWRNTLQPLYDKGIGVFPCRGNHDTGSIVSWDNVFSEEYSLPGNGPEDERNITYSFVHENVFVVALDEYVTRGQINQAWLDKQFILNKQPHVFVFAHEPVFQTISRGYSEDQLYERDRFWNSIRGEGGRIYFCGHDHCYNHARIEDGDGDIHNDIHQFVVGTGGAPLYDWSGDYDGDNDNWTPINVFHEKKYGYVLVEINGLKATLIWKHRTVEGVYEATEDKFTYTCSP